ncbi:MAG: type II toxin-antitoxin system VapC family toxin [Actinomycetota bacterium]
MIVTDSSALIAALIDEGAAGESVRRRLSEDGDLHAPHLLDLEVISVVRRWVQQGRLSEERGTFALEELADLVVARYPHWPLRSRIWELRGNLSVYDAAYIALAETIGCPLLTGDRRLAGAPGIACDVEVV